MPMVSGLMTRQREHFPSHLEPSSTRGQGHCELSAPRGPPTAPSVSTPYLPQLWGLGAPGSMALPTASPGSALGVWCARDASRETCLREGLRQWAGKGLSQGHPWLQCWKNPLPKRWSLRATSTWPHPEAAPVHTPAALFAAPFLPAHQDPCPLQLHICLMISLWTP